MAKIVDVTFNDDTLTDSMGNLTAGALKRVSDATYHDSDLLKRSFGNRENAINFSEDENGGTEWDYTTNVTFTALVADPDGGTTAVKFTGSGGAGKTHFAEAAAKYALTSDSYAVASAYVKIGTAYDPDNWIYLCAGAQDAGQTQSGAWFQLEGAGDVGNGTETGSAVNPVITSEGDNWYRVSFAYDVLTTDGQVGFIYVAFAEADGDSSIAASADTWNLIVYGLQLEELPSGNTIGDELIADQVDRDFSGASDWTNTDINAYDETGDLTITASAIGQFCTLAAAEAVMAQNNWYVLEFDVANIANTWTISDFDDGFEIGVVSANGTDKQIIFKYTDASTGGLRITSDHAASSADFDNFSLKQIPDVALLYPSTLANVDDEAEGHATRDISAIPRIEDGSALAEGEAVNLLDYSEDFTEWTVSDATIESTSFTGPDGEAYTTGHLKENSDTSTHYIVYTITSELTDDADHTASIYVKKPSTNGRSWIALYIKTKAGTLGGSWFNISSGELGTNSGSDDRGIETDLEDNDWYRIWVTEDIGSAAGVPQVILYLGDSDTGISYAGDNASGVYLYGAQLEESPSYPTSYIPTSGCPTIRTTEAGSATTGYSWTMSAALRNSIGNIADSEFTMIVEWTPKHSYTDLSGSNSVVISDSDKPLFITNNAGLLYGWDGSSSSTVDADFVRDTTYLFFLRAFADNGDFDFEVGEKHGGVTTWDATPATYDGSFNPSSVIQLAYGSEFPMHIGRLIFYDEALTRAEIEGEPWATEGGGFSRFRLGMNVS